MEITSALGHTDAIFSSMLNHEGKTLMVMAMESGESYGRQTLHALVGDLPGATEENIGSKNLQYQYCGVLARAGIVSKDPERSSYAVSDFGDYEAKALGAAVLTHADAYDVGQGVIFGATQKPKTGTTYSAALKRLQIVRDVLEPSEHTDWRGLALDTQVHAHLIFLAKHGLLQFDSWDRSKEQVTFVKGDKDPNDLFAPSAHPNDWFVKAVETVYAKESVTLDELAETCRAQFPEGTSLPLMRRRLSVSLAGAVTRGVITRPHSIRSEDGGLNRRIRFTEEQRAFWSELDEYVEAFTDGSKDFLDYWRDRADSIIEDGELIGRALGRLILTSPMMITSKNGEIHSLVEQVLCNATRPLSVSEIAKHVHDVAGRMPSARTVRNSLSRLEKSVGLTINTHKTTAYSLVSSQNIVVDS